MAVPSLVYNEPLFRGRTALSSLHQVQGGKERGRKEEARGGEGCVYAAHRRGVTTAGSI